MDLCFAPVRMRMAYTGCCDVVRHDTETIAEAHAFFAAYSTDALKYAGVVWVCGHTSPSVYRFV